jgi:hypothetical protein
MCPGGLAFRQRPDFGALLWLALSSFVRGQKKTYFGPCLLSPYPTLPYPTPPLPPTCSLGKLQQYGLDPAGSTRPYPTLPYPTLPYPSPQLFTSAKYTRQKSSLRIGGNAAVCRCPWRVPSDGYRRNLVGVMYIFDIADCNTIERIHPLLTARFVGTNAGNPALFFARKLLLYLPMLSRTSLYRLFRPSYVSLNFLVTPLSLDVSLIHEKSVHAVRA